MQNNIDQSTDKLEENPETFKNRIVSQLKEKDEEIFRLKEELANTHQYLTEFVYAAAHALKTPVANLNLVTILLEKTEDIDEVKSYMQTIKSSIKRLDQTIHGMVLGFQVKAIEDNPEQISVAAIVDSVLIKNQVQLNSLSTKVKIDFESCPEIFYNKNILSEIINILINNALIYKSEQRNLQVDLKSERIGEIVLLQIKDNGIGIDLEKHGKDLFQPFKKFSPRSHGNGMGLYLAKTLIEKNHGRIEIESRPDFGTKVKCYFKEQQKNR